MRTFGVKRLLGLWLGGLVLVLVTSGLSLYVGTSGVGWPAGFAWDVRLDRTVTAALVGASLAASGVGYQAALRNPLAEPYLLGVSGGAALAAFVWTLPMLALPWYVVGPGRELFVFVGAACAAGVVLGLAGGARRGIEPGRAVLVGVVVSITCGGVFALLTQIVREPTGGGGAGGAMAFLFGRVSGTTPGHKAWLAAACVGTCAVLAYRGGSLRMLCLSDAESRTLGLDAAKARLWVLVWSSLAAAVATGAVGPVGFVGLIGPHLARLVVGVDERAVLPVGVAVGAVLVVVSDAVGRGCAVVFGGEVAAGIITNLVGGPFFLLLLYTRKRRT